MKEYYKVKNDILWAKIDALIYDLKTPFNHPELRKLLKQAKLTDLEARTDVHKFLPKHYLIQRRKWDWDPVIEAENLNKIIK